MKKLIKKFLYKVIPSLEFSRGGERQVQSELEKIRADHRGRYKFASNFITPESKVLDAACGVGYGAFIIAKEVNGSEIIGVDIEKRAIDYANKYYKTNRIKYEINDVMKLAFSPAIFDAVVSFETIEHLENAERFLEDITGFLKSGGKLIVSSPNQDVMPFDKNQFPYHIKHFTNDELSNILIKMGYNIDGVYSQHEQLEETVKENANGKFLIVVATKK
ncbi:MAG: class I SAM-dependent methyltransferase [Melioribacteraceae bacterium]|nr:class I SAM-dependent methyltransferase [Melioribacteraceae bacterium]MCF8265477.1 class I SAM-dependent methyltransferase [Melioribacteraceae bacterium]MCF8431104.1 class I SAM-dependent methyltransferase [Melioribacteraceae bacterium]